MKKTLATLRDMLTHLCKSRKTVSGNGDWDNIFMGWSPIEREELEELFTPSKTLSGPVEVDFSQRGKVLYLPPLEKNPGCVPILSLYCKLNEQQNIAKLRVMLVSLNKKGKPYGIGFRMETPESMNQGMDMPAGGGIHDFHHVQLIQRFKQEQLDSKLQINCPCWIPESQPSFPLPAECPVTLLLCLIVTLYGRKYYNQFLTEHQIFDINRHLKKIDRWINWKQN